MARTTVTVSAYQPDDIIWCLDRHSEKITDGVVKKVVVTQQGATTATVVYSVQSTTMTLKQVDDADAFDTVDDALAELKAILTN
jgi:uncharacterized protein YkuJ